VRAPVGIPPPDGARPRLGPVRVVPTVASMDAVPAPDVREFAFTDAGPWVVDPDALAWNVGLDQLRLQTRADAQRLLVHRRLPPLRRMTRVVVVLAGALVRWRFHERGTPESRASLARRLRVAFERLGSTYVKLGQIVSAFEGLFPDDLVNEFKRLRDQVPAEPTAKIRALVERELGRPIDEVFAEFSDEPLAAASIAQVHAARLITGEEVVVKVQRPRVGALVRADLRAMAWISPFLVGRIPVAALANPPTLIELFAEQVTDELDFRLEAENMLDLAHVFAVTDQRTMVVPRPHPALVTRRVLVMERMHGFAFDDVEAMHDAGIDTDTLLRAGLIACLEGAVIHGVFHGDLHGGNLLVQPDGRTVLFDFGITGRLVDAHRLAFLRLMVAGITGDALGQLAALRDLGAFPVDTDLNAVARDLDLDQPVKDPTSMSADELVGELQGLIKKLLQYGAGAPKDVMLFVKDLMYLNAATASLAPDLDLIGEIVHVYEYFLKAHGEQLTRDLGEAALQQPDPDAIKASFLVPSDVERLTFRDLQERRRTIIKRLGDRAR
jgi:ubiquinone biosynthesis protein